jgi:hypothetical protein
VIGASAAPSGQKIASHRLIKIRHRRPHYGLRGRGLTPSFASGADVLAANARAACRKCGADVVRGRDHGRATPVESQGATARVVSTLLPFRRRDARP